MSPLRLPPPARPAFFVEDLPGQIPSGFLPIEEAAEVMGVSLDELVDAVLRDQLEAVQIAGIFYVRPAIVSVLGVDDGSGT